MAAETSGRTGGAGTAFMPPAAALPAHGQPRNESGQPGSEPAQQRIELAPPGSAPEPQRIELAPSGAAPEPQQVELAPPGAAPEPQQVELAPPGSAPEPQRVELAPSGAAPEPRQAELAQPGSGPALQRVELAQPAPGRQPIRPPLQSDDELEAVKRYVLLGIAVRILDHDIRVVDSSRLKLPRFYESVLRGLQDRALLELAALRRMFRTTGIKIYEERKEPDGLTAAYVCRGYHHHFTMPWSFVRAEAERLLKRYTARE